MMGFVFKVCQIVREHGTDVLTDFQAKVEMAGAQNNFVTYLKFFRQVVKQMAEKTPIFEGLWLRISYN
jgi:hypothetical protein